MAKLKNYAIIPARGGSKRIPRKNIRNFIENPMISYPIKEAIDSKIFDGVFVSTDDSEIARIAEDFGATVPFLRSPSLSGDEIGTVPVISDFIRKMKLEDTDRICCVYATNPFLESQNLVLGLNKLNNHENINYVCAVTKYNYPVQRALSKNSEGFLNMKIEENLLRHSQSFEEMWHDAGQFYWASSKIWKSEVPMLTNTIGIEIPIWQSVDIDTEEDWIKAERLYMLNKMINI